jgi:hypothetical protein
VGAPVAKAAVVSAEGAQVELTRKVAALFEQQLVALLGVRGVARCVFRITNDEAVLEIRMSPEGLVKFVQALNAEEGDSNLDAVLEAVEEAGRDLYEQVYGSREAVKE